MDQSQNTRDTYTGNGRSGKSAGQLMKEVTEDLSTLIRKEIELAKQEVGESISTKVKGAAIFAIVGVSVRAWYGYVEAMEAEEARSPWRKR